jgi:cyclophilin family peptidyl-prolyl cis-trans isomerase
MKPLPIAALLAAALLAGCATPQTPTTTYNVSTSFASGASACAGQARSLYPAVPASHTLVALTTDKGCLVAELYDDKAPATVANFKTYVTEGFYTDLQFHRILTGFVSQTGGITGSGNPKTPTHPPIKDEAKSSGLHNYQYTLAMARTSEADSATTQFYVNAANNTAGHSNNLDPGGVSPDGYAVFGILVGGRGVADHINSFATGRSQIPILQSVAVLA